MDVQGIHSALANWLDDICVRFIINLPREELESVERIIFQVEEGHWYYEDFIRPLDQTLPSLNLRQFCYLVFQYCPLLQQFSDYHAAAFTEFLAYKTRVPVRGAIMLDQSMEHVLLVKGWKKNASWSFPRGKINKDENDLDCAIRETYEETGYNVRAAGLIPDDNAVKYIDVTLREQQLKLYVIRGVPLDTYFEPRTRKEISKIDWYRIADLPGGRKQVTNDTINDQKSKFYMVAPFIGHLKGWIKQQRRQDRMKSGLHAPEPVLVEDSGFETDYAPNNDGLIAVNAPELHEDNHSAGHLQFLLSRLGQPQDIPMPHQANEAGPTDELALELKKLLSIGASSTVPTQSEQVNSGSLMSFLNPGTSQVVPQTPIEQIESSPPQVASPRYINRPPQISEFSRPPPFPFHPATGNMEQPRHTFSFANTSGPSYHQPPPTQPAPHQKYPQRLQHAQHSHHIGPPPPYQHHPHMVPHPPHHFHLHPQHGLIAPTSQPQSHQQFPSHGGPSASKLPQPRLNQQNLALLNVFKSGAISNEDHAVSPITHTLELPSENVMPSRAVQAPQNIAPPRADSSSTQTTRPTSSGQENQPNRSVQQKTLLGLFRNPATAQAASAVNGVALPVVELGSGTPQQQASHFSAKRQFIIQKTNEYITAQNKIFKIGPKLTSATVSGPLDAPDFDLVARNRPPAELGNGSENGQSPTPVHTVDASVVLEAPRPFAPSTILQRQHTPAHVPQATSSTSTPVASAVPGMSTATFDRRDAQPATQKSTLMSLFGATVTKTPSALPPAQRTSINASPVSPLPDRRVPVRSQPTSMSQISSLGGSFMADQTSNPPALAPVRSRVSSFEVGETGSAKSQSPITPVEKRFLFQYLQGVVSEDGKH